MGLHRQFSFLARVTVATGIVAALISAGIVVANPVVASARTTYTWTQMAPATSPSARRAASMAYDTATGHRRVVGEQPSHPLSVFPPTSGVVCGARQPPQLRNPRFLGGFPDPPPSHRT